MKKKISTTLKALVAALMAITVLGSALTAPVLAATTTIGNIAVDLDSDDLSGQLLQFADDTYYKALMTNTYTIGAEEATLQVSKGLIYGTKDYPFMIVHVTNITTTNTPNLNLVWNAQKPINMSGYTFLNAIPDSLTFPMPIYISAGTSPDRDTVNTPDVNYVAAPTVTDSNFVFMYPIASQMQGDIYTNSAVTLNNLRTRFAKAGYKSYTFGIYKETSSYLQIDPHYYYKAAIGSNVDDLYRVTQNPISWDVTVPMNVKYTVDIAPLNEGGTPSLSGLTVSADLPTISDAIIGVNSGYFRSSTDPNANITEKSLALGDKITLSDDLAADSLTGDRHFGTYGDKYGASTTLEAGYHVDYVTVTICNPLTGVAGATKTYKSLAAALKAQSSIAGRTEIRVHYAKTVVPETGDSTNVLMYAGLALVSLTGIVIFIGMHRKHQYQ